MYQIRNIPCINKTITIFRRLSSVRSYVIITFLFLLLFFAATGRPYGTLELTVITGGLQVPDLSFEYSSQSVYSLLDSFGQAGRDLYLTRILPLDILFAFSYLFFFTITLGILIRYLLPSRPELQGLVMIPVIGAFADIVENVCFALVLMTYPTPLHLVVAFSSVFTKVKFVCNGIAIILIIVALIAVVIKIAHHMIRKN